MMENRPGLPSVEAPSSSSAKSPLPSTLQAASNNTVETLTTEGSEGYRSGGEYGSDDYNSDGGYGSGYNSDDTAGANPKTIFTNVVPVEKLKNGWNVMTTMFGRGLAFTKEKATDVYNSETVQSIKERTSEAATRTSEAAVASYEYGKERAGPVIEVTKEKARGAWESAGPVIEVTKEKARGAWESTKEGVSAAKAKAAPMVKDFRTSVHMFTGMPIRPDGDDSAETSEYEGLSPLSVSPPSMSPASFSPPLSPKSSRAESPVNEAVVNDASCAPGSRNVVAGTTKLIGTVDPVLRPEHSPAPTQPSPPTHADLLT